MKKCLIILIVMWIGFLFKEGQANSNGYPLPKKQWSFQSPLGTYDRASAQRGYQVYKEVCSVCHGMKLLRYRHLTALGFTPAEIKALASQVEVTDGPNDEEGQLYQRKGRPSDSFPAPYANEQAARAANNGSLPPDLSLMVKARQGGARYVYALLTGYQEPPSDVKLMPGMHYNPYFPGGQIAMIPPLHDGLVTYADGTEATTAQMAEDVVTFLSWAAEPELEARKQMGIKVLIFLSIFTLLMFLVKRRIWRNVH